MLTAFFPVTNLCFLQIPHDLRKRGFVKKNKVKAKNVFNDETGVLCKSWNF
ncbi:hypothetical protein N748_14955 [Legionella pneumophila str. 121004]|nr:hypothetical protein N748_14955 [Legionella pneumophila str. 121004]ERH44557.1 hypothetical protein N750_08970 [Legionella pneumophila str. Leg01/53]ERI48454.1 hypothetical protein N749_09680 [Legionella pneumophila str. Leg01/20]